MKQKKRKSRKNFSERLKSATEFVKVIGYLAIAIKNVCLNVKEIFEIFH